MSEKTHLSRRRALLGLGTIGVGAVAGGGGTMAYFSDEESSTGNTVTAGELDLTIDVTDFSYNGPDENLEVNPVDGGANFALSDLKPGDAGHCEVRVAVNSNPAWVHLGGDLTDYENGRNEPEKSAGDSSGGDPGAGNGELSDLIQVHDWRVRVVDDQGNEVGTKEYFQQGSLAEIFSESRIGGGVLLDGEPLDGTVLSGQEPFRAGYEYYLDFHWQWNSSSNQMDNRAQGDAVEFDLLFHAQQRRHNDDPTNPFADDD